MESGVRFGITVLGSGSGGNSILLHTADEGLLVDAGFSRRETLLRVEGAGVRPEIIKALLISHEHGDHTRGAKALADHLGICTYGTSRTIRHLSEADKAGGKLAVFESGSSFDIGGFNVRVFSVPHDAIDPVGFIVSRGGARAAIATDLGHLNALCIRRLSDCEAVILECNHDVAMQRNSERHQILKSRILGKHGHLCNDDAISAFASFISPSTRFICLAHLSEECNRPELVRELALKRLAELNRSDILLAVAEQDKASETVWL